jgi:hypothetical protein
MVRAHTLLKSLPVKIGQKIPSSELFLAFLGCLAINQLPLYPADMTLEITTF